MFRKIPIEIGTYQDNFNKIRKDDEWEVIIANKEILFEEICKHIFSVENIYFYLASKESSRTLKEVKKISLELKSNKIIASEKVKKIFKSHEWLTNNTNIKKFAGDLGEYIMYIFIDFLNISETLISKLVYKTSDNMPVYGCDGYFYDWKNEILYFAESKFWSSLENALKNAINFLNKQKPEKNLAFIYSHTSDIKAKDNKILKIKREKFESIDDLSDITLKQIIFIMQDECYYKNDIKKKIENLIGKNYLEPNLINSSIFVFFPIISKNEFLEYVQNKIKEFNNE